MNFRHKIVLILPYFGRFNNYFPLYLESCRFNPTIDWMIFTDDKRDFDYPNNVQVNYFSFETFKDLIQHNYDFRISLKNPYRLCNFKPAFGDIFRDYIKDFDFWGYCDNDIIWGNIRNFLSDEILDNYNRIFEFGHLSLIRNLPKYNEYYKFNDAYKLAFAEDYNLLFFDELGFTDIWRRKDEKIYRHTSIADFNPRQYNFKLNKGCTINDNFNTRHIYSWDKGRLVRHYLTEKGVETEDVMYIHFLKRNMCINENFNYKDSYYIIPNEFINSKHVNLSMDYISKNSKNKFYYDYWRKRITLRSLAKKLYYRVLINPGRKAALNRIKSKVKQTS